ncbi:MAG: glycosyltransferase family 39 protein [Candidatus Levybacteria bacterium]|nr:glycosyltransferase family 39 protein [Candidatus Levybacteria bacterium]
MKKIGFIFIVVFFLSLILVTQLQSINSPLKNNDEGIYLTTFLLINSNHSAYKETFLSQPPGFLLSVYPGFILFGKSLQAARLTIGLWSLIGLLAIVWICLELKNPLAAILTLGILYLIPYYFNQTLIFQSDALAIAFSLISLAFLLRFFNTKSFKWFIVSAIFVNLVFWTKFDFFLIPSLITISLFLIKDRQLTRSKMFILTGIFIVVTVIFYLFLIAPFGIQYVFNNTVGLRLAAASLQTPPLVFFTYIGQDALFFLLIIVTGIFIAVRKESFRFPLLPIFVWVCTIFIFLTFYKPLYSHHMIIFVVPVVLFFSLSVTFWLKKYPSFYSFIIFCILLIAAFNYVSIIPKKSSGILTPDQQKAVEVINKYTYQKDIVVTDEEILNGVTGRLPPAQLSDVSFVRIFSNNLSPEKFKQIINTTKPKLIIPWNGRLWSIRGFNSILSGYRPLTTINNKTIYFRD